MGVVVVCLIRKLIFFDAFVIKQVDLACRPTNQIFNYNVTFVLINVLVVFVGVSIGFGVICVI